MKKCIDLSGANTKHEQIKFTILMNRDCYEAIMQYIFAQGNIEQAVIELAKINPASKIVLGKYEFNSLCVLDIIKSWSDGANNLYKEAISHVHDNEELLPLESIMEEGFIMAVESGNTEIVKLLLADARVNPVTNDNYVILYTFRQAARKGHLEVIKLLLTNIRVDPADDDNDAIRQAAKGWPLGVLRLTNTRIDQVAACYACNEAIIEVASSGHLEIVRLLLADDRVDPSAESNYAISQAAKNGHLEVVKLLLSDDRVDPTDNENDAIYLAIYNGHLEIVKLLLADSRVNPAVKDNYAIRLVASRGHLEVVKLLLSNDRVDPAAKNNHAICLASENGHLEVVRLLLADARVNSAAGYNAAICGAAGGGHLEVVRLLLADARVNLTEEFVDLLIIAMKTATRAKKWEVCALVESYNPSNRGLMLSLLAFKSDHQSTLYGLPADILEKEILARGISTPRL